MGSTYYSLHYHWVCSTKDRRPFVEKKWRAEFHRYIGGTIGALDGTPLKVGGLEDHAHALIGLKTTHCVADVARELKKSTSIWAAEHHEPEFLWQEGYSIFTVSSSMLLTVSDYIERLEEHHKKVTFAEELEQLLKKHGIKYDQKYLL